MNVAVLLLAGNSKRFGNKQKKTTQLLAFIHIFPTFARTIKSVRM